MPMLGQAVMYPIVNLRRLKRGARAYVEGLEDSVIAAVGRFDIAARVRAGPPIGSRLPLACAATSMHSTLL